MYIYLFILLINPEIVLEYGRLIWHPLYSIYHFINTLPTPKYGYLGKRRVFFKKSKAFLGLEWLGMHFKAASTGTKDILRI